MAEQHKEASTEQSVQIDNTQTKTPDNIVKRDRSTTVGGSRRSWATLASIATGRELPLMRIHHSDTGKEWYEYQDEKGEWLEGASIVMPDDAKLGNKSQQYATALTYARRQTALMGLKLAVEDGEPDETDDVRQPRAIPETGELATPKQIDAIYRFGGIPRGISRENLTKAQASEILERYIEQKKQNRL